MRSLIGRVLCALALLACCGCGGRLSEVRLDDPSPAVVLRSDTVICDTCEAYRKAMSICGPVHPRKDRKLTMTYEEAIETARTLLPGQGAWIASDGVWRIVGVLESQPHGAAKRHAMARGKTWEKAFANLRRSLERADRRRREGLPPRKREPKPGELEQTSIIWEDE